MIKHWFVAATGFALALVSTSVAARGQGGLLPNGDFEHGVSLWRNVRFDDPAGSTGVALANVAGTATSQALFADFRSASFRSSCNWLSDYHVLTPGTYPVSFRVMWQKPRSAVIGDPSGNYIEVYLLDASNRHVFSSHVPVTRTAQLVDRRSFTGQVTVPVTGRYRAYVILQHTETAGMEYVAWVDDIVVGSSSWSLFGTGCPGTGAFVPDIGAEGTPALGSTDWKLRLTGAFAPSFAILTLGTSTASWQGRQLPFDLGGGCAILSSVDWTLFLPVAGGIGSGGAVVPVGVPADPAWQGASLHAQWLVVDPGSGSPFGMTTTRGLAFVIG